MPIYEFECTKCYDIMERFIRITDEKRVHTVKCGNCGGVAKRILSPNTFHLKGDGWFNKPSQEE